MRFVLLEQELGLNPARIDRGLKSLLKGKWIVSVAADTATGRFLMVYRITRKGTALLAALHEFAAVLQRREADLGPEVARELRAVLN